MSFQVDPGTFGRRIELGCRPAAHPHLYRQRRATNEAVEAKPQA